MEAVPKLSSDEAVFLAPDLQASLSWDLVHEFF